MSITVCKLPKADLGNQLFSLMKAQVFAHLNNLPIIITRYHQLKIGPYLRKEKTKRNYNGFFAFEKNIFFYHLDKIKLLQYNFNNSIEEPSIEKSKKNKERKIEIFLFYKVPHWENYFEGLSEHRILVKKYYGI